MMTAESCLTFESAVGWECAAKPKSTPDQASPSISERGNPGPAAPSLTPSHVQQAKRAYKFSRRIERAGEIVGQKP
jgi:hypothetical protein